MNELKNLVKQNISWWLVVGTYEIEPDDKKSSETNLFLLGIIKKLPIKDNLKSLYL